MRIATAALAMALALSGVAHAKPEASFDCGKAKSIDEVTICSDTGLADLDRQVAARFKELQGKTPDAARKDLVADQRAWIAARNKACDLKQGLAAIQKHVKCFKEQYQARLTVLTARVGSAVPPTVAAGGSALTVPAAEAPKPASVPATAVGATPGAANALSDLEGAWSFNFVGYGGPPETEDEAYQTLKGSKIEIGRGAIQMGAGRTCKPSAAAFSTTGTNTFFDGALGDFRAGAIDSLSITVLKLACTGGSSADQELHLLRNLPESTKDFGDIALFSPDDVILYYYKKGP